MRLRLASLALVPALACGPSLARLERGHHYDQAVCGAQEHAFPEEQVTTILRRALDPALHVAVVPRDRLAAALGDDAPELQQVAFLRITHDSNAIPLREFDATVALRRGGEPLDVKPIDLSTVAAVFRERVPGPTTIQPGALEHAAHAVGTVGAVVLTIASLGILGGLLRGRGSGPSSRTVYPTDEDIRRAAPRASRLHDAIAHLQAYCPDRPGERCHSLVLVQRPADESADLALSVQLRYAAPPCALYGIAETVELPLPPGPTLEARLAAMFGDDMRKLSDLARTQ